MSILRGVLIAALSATVTLTFLLMAINDQHQDAQIQQLEQRVTLLEARADSAIPAETPVPQPAIRKPQPTPRYTSQFEIIRTDRTIDHVALDRFCLAKNIYHEARGESLLGQYAVAQVTLNRVKSPRWPNDVCHVVMQPWQFSWANDRTQRWTHPNTPDWERAKAIAEDVLAGGARVQGLETALFYHADWVRPNWKSTNYLIAQIDTHIFYSGDRKR